MVDAYVLDDEGNPIAEPDLRKWSAWFNEGHRRVDATEVCGKWVSTVFLGIDHGFGGGPPILWETMVFSNAKGRFMGDIGQDLGCKRYCRLVDAKAGHVATVAAVERGEI